MNVKPTQEQSILRESVAKFCKAEFGSERVRELSEKEPTGVTVELWRKMAEQGWIGAALPPEHGGLGLGAVELGIIMEELGRVVAPGPFMSSAALGGPAIALGGTDPAKSQWLEKIALGEAIASLAILEEDAQLGPEQVHATAARAGDGWVLSGKKFFVPDLVAADIIVVAARSAEGVGLFIVEQMAPGVKVEENKLTDMTSRSGQLILDKVKVGPDALVGKPGQGWAIVEEVLRLGNVCVAAACVAGCDRLLAMTIDYAKQRHQFGRPIGSFQAVKHPLADLFAEIESARSAYLYAAWAVDAGSPDAAASVAVARVACAEAYRNAGYVCLQAHGGIGFTWEYDLHLFLKRAKHYQYFLGVAEDYEETIAREALKI